MTMTLDGTAGMTAPQGAVYNGLQTAGAQTSTSGTAIDFTNIPVWARRITVILSGVSTNGTSAIIAQLGSGTFVTSGYLSTSTDVGASTGITAFTTGLAFMRATSAATLNSYTMTLVTPGNNAWIAQVLGYQTASFLAVGTGYITLSGTLDRVRVTTLNGTDTFDAGTINIIYE